VVKTWPAGMSPELKGVAPAGIEASWDFDADRGTTGRHPADLSLIDSYWGLAPLLPYRRPRLDLIVSVRLTEAHLGQNEYDGEEYRPRNHHL
jgi:hypothetical protein